MKRFGYSSSESWGEFRELTPKDEGYNHEMVYVLLSDALKIRSKTIEEACDAIAKTCEDCGGAGFTIGIGTEAGHGCDGTEESCGRNCPIPIQVQIQEPCEFCHRFIFPAQEAIRALNNEKE